MSQYNETLLKNAVVWRRKLPCLRTRSLDWTAINGVPAKEEAELIGECRHNVSLLYVSRHENLSPGIKAKSEYDTFENQIVGRVLRVSWFKEPQMLGEGSPSSLQFKSPVSKCEWPPSLVQPSTRTPGLDSYAISSPDNSPMKLIEATFAAMLR
jgi:hypothetical protein